jgi:hypothetical protein
MDKASRPEAPKGPRRGGGNKTAERVIHEERIIKALVPPGSRFKGYESFVVQDLVLRPHVIRFRRERWLTPDGETVVAPLPADVRGHFGAELRRFGSAPPRARDASGFHMNCLKDRSASRRLVKLHAGRR